MEIFFNKREEMEKFTTVREVYDWVESALTAFVLMILVLTFAGRIISVDGESMEHTLQHMDRLISTRLIFTPEYGDIVVVAQPSDPSRPLIKRVIATQGQVIDIDFETGDVTVDGLVLDEPYIAEPTYRSYDLIFPMLVPQGHVFVMGDNRNYSWDSRDSGVGMVDERLLIGRAIYRILPPESMGVPDKGWE